MPRLAVEDNSRNVAGIPAGEKAILLRAARCGVTDLTDFVRQYSLSAARGSDSGSGTSGTLRADSLRVWRCWRTAQAEREAAGRGESLPKRKWNIRLDEEPIGKRHDRAAFDCGERR